MEHIDAGRLDERVAVLALGDRYVTLSLELAPREPGDGLLSFSAEWLDDNIAAPGEDAPAMERFAFDFHAKNTEEER